MRKALRWIAAVLFVLILAFVLFYLWASRPVYDETSYSRIRTYEAAARPVLLDTISVATYNIGYLSGMINNRPVRESEAYYAVNLAAARELVSRMYADVIGFQEIDFGSRRSYDMHQADSLAAGNYGYAATAVNWDVRYVPFPYGLPNVHFGRILSGQAILSRFPISSQDRIVLDKPPNPFWYNAFYLDRLAQIAYLDTEPKVAIVSVHLEAFHRATREDQAEELLGIVDSLASDYAVFLIGDFNASPASLFDENVVSRSEAAQRRGERTMEVLASHEILEAVYDSEVLRAEEAMTFPADQPRIKIDHILYDRRFFRPIDASVFDAEGPPADHRPVLAVFVRIEGETDD